MTGFGHDHGHDHHHGHSAGERGSRKPLAIALVITLIFMVAEIIGGVMTRSLALLADAGHMATDAAALALALGAAWLARRPPTPSRSFGLYRAEVLAALVNAGTLVAISLYIFKEAFSRLGDPPTVSTGPMLGIAILGLLANAASAWVLMRGGGHVHNLNTRAAFLHVVGDMLGSVGAIAAAVIMMLTGWYIVDPILSAGIGGLILWSSWRLMRESVDVLLESAPSRIDVPALEAAMASVRGVSDIHDLHVWTLTSGVVALSSHVEIRDGEEWHDVLDALGVLLREEFGINHVTLQPEQEHASPHAFRGCALVAPEGPLACRALIPVTVLVDGPADGHEGDDAHACDHPDLTVSKPPAWGRHHDSR